MLHPSDDSVISLPRQKCRYVLWKTKIYCILLELPVHSREFQQFQKRTKTEPARFFFFFTKERQLIHGFGKTKLTRLHPNFNYALTSEMTFKRWKGGKETAKWAATTLETSTMRRPRPEFDSCAMEKKSRKATDIATAHVRDKMAAIHIIFHYSKNLSTKFTTTSCATFRLRFEWSSESTTSLQTTPTTEVATLQVTSMSDFTVSQSGSMTMLVFK